MQNIQGPINLIQKSMMIRRCMKCGVIFFPIISSDESVYGGHYFGFGQPTIENSDWMCEECWGIIIL